MAPIKHKLSFITLLILIGTTSFILSLKLFPWDVLAYILNGKYWIRESYYFEIYRPPVLPVFFAFLEIFFNNYYIDYAIFIILSSLLFYASLSKFIRVTCVKCEKEFFYLITAILSLFPLFYYSFSPTGTEIISLSFALLSIAYLISKNKYASVGAGLFLSLASLTRYTYVSFIPLLFLLRKPKKIFVSLITFSIPWVIWTTYNKLVWGKFLYSFVNSYFLNIVSRADISQPIFFGHILVIALTLALLIAGILVSSKEDRTLIMIALYVWLVSTYVFVKIPLKIDRYLYSLILSIILSGAVYSKNINKVEKLRKLLPYFTILSLLISTVVLYELYFSKPIFIVNNKDIKSIYLYIHNKTSCIYSDYWIYYDAYGIKAYPLDFLYNPDMSKPSNKVYSPANMLDKCTVVIAHGITPKFDSEPYKVDRIDNAEILFFNNIFTGRNRMASYYMKYSQKVIIDTLLEKRLVFNNEDYTYEQICNEALLLDFLCK